MIFLKLFYSFMIIGSLSFGGAYSAIPLVRDVAESFGTFSEEFISDLVAISESTPGPIGVNLATFVGIRVANIPGGIVATIAEVLPAFVIMIVFSIYFSDIINSHKVKYVLSIIRPCVIGIIMATGLYMLAQNTGLNRLMHGIYNKMETLRSIVVLVLLLIMIKTYQKLTSKRLGVISVIIIGAIFGIAINIFV